MKNNLLKGNSPDIISANVKTLCEAGYSQSRAMRCALCHANKGHSKHAKSVAAKVAKKDPVGVRVKK